MSTKNLLPPKTGDLSDWYTAIIKLADFVDYGPAKGSMIIKPYGYAIWERAVAELDAEIKKRGVQNAYFPLFIPMSLLHKEADHVEGFAPELAVVTHGGGEVLEEPLVVRPTSETIMYNSYSKWVQSWRDLPILINQWNNVVRWEKRTMPFLRTSEFLWQEGHTAHATHDEAVALQLWAIETYTKIYREVFAMEGYEGWKSTAERFAGAATTLTYESLMPSGKALQACTSHDLAQNFSKPFNISFQDKDGSMQHVWQTSWGFSTRSVGGLILAHGDDNGLVLPPRLAPHQVVIVPVKPDDEATILYCRELEEKLRASTRVLVDDRDDETFGYRLNKWELKGAPLVCKIGGSESKERRVTIKRRFDGQQIEVAIDELEKTVSEQLADVQAKMLEKSREHILAETREAKDYDEFKQLISKHRGFIKVYWNDNPDIEKKIKEETKATSRCMPLLLQRENAKEVNGVDFYTGEPSSTVWLFAQSY
jgi:prolyl-tRNA synthetase